MVGLRVGASIIVSGHLNAVCISGFRCACGLAISEDLGVHVCLEKFTCLESTARLAVQLEYAMTYPLEDRPQGSLQERWSNLPGDRARVGGSTASTRTAPPSCFRQDKCAYFPRPLGTRPLSVTSRRGTSHQTYLVRLWPSCLLTPQCIVRIRGHPLCLRVNRCASAAVRRHRFIPWAVPDGTS